MNKLDRIKSKEAAQKEMFIKIDQSEQVEALKSVKNELQSLYALINEKEEYDFDKLARQLDRIAHVVDFSESFQKLEKAIENTKVEIPPMDMAVFTKILTAVEKNKPTEVDVKPLEKAIVEVTQTIRSNSVDENNAPEDYMPVRRVIKEGNRLVFDDQRTSASRAGGGGGSSSSSGGLTDAQLRASPVDVSATIDTTGLATTATDTNTAAIKTAVEIIDNAIAGSEMQVDVVGALPTGNNNIGDVDVASSVLPSGASTSAKQDTLIGHLDGVEGLLTTIDTDTGGIATSTASIDTKTPALGQALAAGSVPIVLTASQLTTLTPPAAISGFATSAKQDTVISHVDGLEGLLATIDGDTGNISTKIDTLAGAVSGTEFQVDVLTMPSTAVTNAGLTELAAAINASSQMDVNIAAGNITGFATSAKQDTAQTSLDSIKTAVEILDNTVAGSELQVDVLTMPTVAVTQSGAWDEVGINDSGNSITVDNGGTFAVQGTAVGTIADDATTPGAPVMIGGQAVETDGTDPTSVSAEDDVARVRTDRNRRILVNTFHPNLWRASENHATAQTNNELRAAPGAGLSLYITDIIISNGATAGDIKIVEDTGGTPVDLLENLYVAINGGAVINLATPIRVTANKNVGFTSATVTTHSVTLAGFTAP